MDDEFQKALVEMAACCSVLLDPPLGHLDDLAPAERVSRLILPRLVVDELDSEAHSYSVGLARYFSVLRDQTIAEHVRRSAAGGEMRVHRRDAFVRRYGRAAERLATLGLNLADPSAR